MHRLRRRLYPALCLTLLLGFSLPLAVAQEQQAKPDKPAKLFSSNDTLKVTLTGPWQDVMKKKKSEDAYPATLDYTDELGQAQRLPLTVERRGITRQRICNFPPIRLRFEKQDVKGTTFRGQKSLKMVTHCKTSSSYEDYYVLEYLAYRIYNLITDMSFRVRPLEVTYVDPDSGMRETFQFAFLIEDDSDVADRFDLKKLRIPKAWPALLDPGTTADLSLFQFLIGNVDWSALRGPEAEECCHNVKLIGPETRRAGDMIHPLPYDFDSSGLVDAGYAAPAEGLPIRNVKQRLYRGYCAHNSALEPSRNRFLKQEQAIYELFSSEPRLDSKRREEALDYVREFFEIIRNDRSFKKEIIEQCRK